MGASLATDPHCAGFLSFPSWHCCRTNWQKTLALLRAFASSIPVSGFRLGCGTAWLLCVSRFARRLCLRIAIPLGPHIAATRTSFSVISSCLRSQHGFVTGPCITGLSGRYRFIVPLTMLRSSHAYLSRTSPNRRLLPVDNEDIGDCFQSQSRIVQLRDLASLRNGPCALTAKASSAQSIAGASDTWSL